MAYQVLAQKYRPQVFEDVIGQEAVTRTLKNSIETGRVANAYLFSGPRGVGKTSVARLISKVLNCENPLKDGPCNKCASCMEITSGNNIDVLEIDGASNRGIDEIRALRENVKFSSAGGKYKIYIIDEVHMLTTEAFNALLKTLEEPPAHVKFIFATTEPHKVIATITSRCQRFDFKRIPPMMIHDRLKKIAKIEKIDLEDKALLLIARSADGSLRDALVVLDQMVSFSEGKITANDVLELLGMVHKEQLFDLSGAIIDNDPSGVTGILDNLISSGKDPVFVANSLISHYRDLMVLKTAGEPTTDMVFTDNELGQMNAQKDMLSLEEILYVLQNLSHCLSLMKGTVFTRAPLEVTLIRLAGRKKILAIDEILTRLEAIEEGRSVQGSEFRVQGGEKAIKEEPDNDIRGTRGEGRKANARHCEEPVAPKSSDEAISTHKQQATSTEHRTPNNEQQARASHSDWKAISGFVKSKKLSVYTFLSHAKPQEISAKKVVLAFNKEHSFNIEVLETGDNKKLIEEALTSVFGTCPKLEFIALEAEEKVSKEDLVKTEEKHSKVKEATDHIIEKALDVFGGRIVRDHTGEGQ